MIPRPEGFPRQPEQLGGGETGEIRTPGRTVRRSRVRDGPVHDAPRLALGLLPDSDRLGGELGKSGLVQTAFGQRLLNKTLMPVPLPLMPGDDGGSGFSKPVRSGNAFRKFAERSPRRIA